MNRDELETEISEIKLALQQLENHPCKGTHDWDNCVKWLSELLEIREAELTKAGD